MIERSFSDNGKILILFSQIQHRRSSKSSFNGSKPESRRGSIEQLILANAVNDEENELFLSQAAEIDDKFCLDSKPGMYSVCDFWYSSLCTKISKKA